VLEYLTLPASLRRMRKLLFLILALSPAIHAQEAHMVVEAYSGKVLSAENSTVKRPVASLTKLATAIVAVDWATATGTEIATEVISVPEIVAGLNMTSPLKLSPGDTLTLRDALNAALLSSDNIAALTIAHHVGTKLLAHRGKNGDPVVTFVAEMNKLCKAIYANNTLFVNTHGLENSPKPGYSTAADMARLSIHAIRRNAITFIVRQKSRQVSVNGSAGKRSYTLTNSNELIGDEGVIGIKTGTTNAAGPCLATCMDRDPLIRTKPDGSKGVTPRRLIVVVLNSPDRFTRSRQLLKSGWAFYDSWLAAGAPVKDPKREILSTPAPK
jgi:D-alanyl-D-alanine carboxypeptidase (penicillin-binding protein 5/6)